MKKIIFAVVMVGIVIGYFVMRDSFSTNKIGIPVISENNAFRPDPSNATFTFDNEAITLSAGRNTKSAAPGSAFVEETILLDKFAYGDINADGKEDTALFLARYGAGSGTFVYLAAFVSGPVTYRGSEAIFIGDRIAPQSISINGGEVTIEYLDRKTDEALAAEPTITTLKRFVYKAGELREK